MSGPPTITTVVTNTMTPTSHLVAVPVAPVYACNRLILVNQYGHATELTQETMAHVISSTFRMDTLEFKFQRQEAVNKTLLAQLRELAQRLDRLESDFELMRQNIEKQQEEIIKQKILREHLSHRETDINEMMNMPGVPELMKELDSVSL